MSLNCKKPPCNNCPYRKDAPLQHWSIDEFRDLLANDKTQLGAVYGYHKNDGKLCTGFVMNQDKRGIPSIKLRTALIADRVAVGDLDTLYCESEMFNTIEEMSIANYPELV